MTILNLFEVRPLEGRIMMEINPTIAYTMMDRVMGGIGSSHNKIDSMTEIETKIMSNLFERTVSRITKMRGNPSRKSSRKCPILK